MYPIYFAYSGVFQTQGTKWVLLLFDVLDSLNSTAIPMRTHICATRVSAQHETPSYQSLIKNKIRK